MAEYDTIITHAGTGTIIAAVTQHKNVIAVPRLSQFGEHVDDHQLEILQRFGDMNLIDPCYDIDDLENQLIQIQTMQFAIYESNTGHIAESIEEFIACM